MSCVTRHISSFKTSSLESIERNRAVRWEGRTSLRSSVDFLVKLLGFRRGDLRAGQLRVDVVRDGLNRRPQTRAAVSAQMAGSELEKTWEIERGRIWYQTGIQLVEQRTIKIRINHNTAQKIKGGSTTTIFPMASTLDKVLEWPNPFPAFLLGFSRERF